MQQGRPRAAHKEGITVMAYLETYRAYAKHHGTSKSQEWAGLTRGQAQWRYQWIARQARQTIDWPKEYGWGRE